MIIMKTEVGLKQKALSRWENEGGANRYGPQESEAMPFAVPMKRDRRHALRALACSVSTQGWRHELV